MEQDLGGLDVLGQLAQGRLRIGLPGDEPLEIGQRHPRLGAARQHRVELDGNPADQFHAAGTRVIDQVQEVAAGTLADHALRAR